MDKRTRIKRTSDSIRLVEVPAAQFKARCLEFMDQVSAGRQEFIITKRGKRVAKLVSVEEEPVPLFGYMKDTVVSYGDIVSSVDEVWDANKLV